MVNPPFEFEFKSFQDYPVAESLSFLWYGPAKSGKTFLAGSVGERSLYIDVGKSTPTLHSPAFIKRFGKFTGFYVPIAEEEPKEGFIVPDKATAYDRVCDCIDKALERIPDKFDVVVLDEATAFRRYGMLKAMEIANKIGRSKTIDRVHKTDVIIADVQDFGAEMSLTEQFVAGTIDLLKRYNKHFIFIAHERNTYKKSDKIGGEDTLTRVTPGFTGKTHPDAISNMFDAVWHFEIYNGDVYRIRTRGNNTLLAGDRFGGVFAEYEDASKLSWELIIKRIREGIPLKK